MHVTLTSPQTFRFEFHLRLLPCAFRYIISHRAGCFTSCCLACRTGGLAGPARYTKVRAKCENEREAPSQNYLFLASRFARVLVYHAGPANPPVLLATCCCTVLDPTRLKLLSSVATLCFQFGLYPVVVPLNFVSFACFIVILPL